MSAHKQRQHTAVNRLANAAAYAKTALNTLATAQDALQEIGEDDAASEIDNLIDLQNEVWLALGRLWQDISAEARK